MLTQAKLHGVVWGFYFALMLAGQVVADDGAGVPSQSHYTQDPIGDAFVAIFDNTEPEQVYSWPPLLLVVPVDINLDGRLDLLVSANYYRNGRQGEISQVFIRADQGYRDLRRPIVPGKFHSIIDFKYDASRIRPNPASRSVSFFDLNTGGGGFCTLFETRISSATVEFRRIAELHAQDEEDRARIQSLQHMFEPLAARIRYMNFGPLQVRYAARLHRERLKLERNMGGKPDKYIPIDYRDPVHAGNFLDNPEQAYALLDGTAPIASSDTEQTPHFESVDTALEYYMKHNAPKWEPAPSEVLPQQFGEGVLIAALEPWVARSDRHERFFALNSLTEVVRRSTDTTARQRFVEQILTGTLDTSDLQTNRDWLESFAGIDFNAGSREFLLGDLTRTKESGGTYSFNARTARWAGVAGVEEAMPVLREINVAQRGMKNWTNNPLFIRSALIALGRMGDTQAALEMIACIERVEDPKERALSLQRLVTAPNPETVDYLKRYLFSDVEHPESSSDWLPVSEAQCAADTLRAMLEGFPEGPLEAQRQWMEKSTEFVFKTAGTQDAWPGPCR